MSDALIATLAAYGPCTSGRLGELLAARPGRVRRQLMDAWERGLVDVEGSTWRLATLGRFRARELRGNERRFEGLVRTRVNTRKVFGVAR